MSICCPVASTIDRSIAEASMIRRCIADRYWRWPKPSPESHLVDDAREALHHARASVVASGTATVQAAVIGNPFVVVYRVSDMTYRVAKRLVQYPAEIPAQVDEAGKSAGGDGEPDRRAAGGSGVAAGAVYGGECGCGAEAAAGRWAGAERMIADLAEVRAKLLPEATVGPRTAIQRVADAVEGLLAGAC